MSLIRSIYTALAALPLSVTIDGSPVVATAYGLDELPGAVEDVMLPCRLLSPLRDGQAGARLVAFTSAPGNRTADWTISDVLLWQRVPQGAGPEQPAPALVDYCAAYIDALPIRSGGRWSVTGLDIRSEIIEWPLLSGVVYDGVRAVVTAREIL